MCGRFVQAGSVDDYVQHFGVELVQTERLAPSYNVAPTDRVYAVADHDGVRRLGSLRWGLVPHWATDAGGGARLINARVETVAAKAAFRDAFRRRRCLVPANGFYEWERRPDGSRLPYYFYRPEAPVALAGLWASWRDPAGEQRLRTCTIVTAPADQVVGAVHGRMPLIVPPERWERWLDPSSRDVDELVGLLRIGESGLVARPVSTLVNNVRNNVPECIAPLGPPP